MNQKITVTFNAEIEMDEFAQFTQRVQGFAEEHGMEFSISPEPESPVDCSIDMVLRIGEGSDGLGTL